MKENDDYGNAMKRCPAAQAIACKCSSPFSCTVSVLRCIYFSLSCHLPCRAPSCFVFFLESPAFPLSIQLSFSLSRILHLSTDTHLYFLSILSHLSLSAPFLPSILSNWVSAPHSPGELSPSHVYSQHFSLPHIPPAPHFSSPSQSLPLCE